MELNEKLIAATKLHEAGRVKEALVIYSEIIHQNKKNPQLLFLIGVSYLELALYEKAIDFLKNSIKFEQNNPLSYYNLGLAFYGIESYEDAVIQYIQAINLKPDYIEAHINLAAAYALLKRYDQSLASYAEALRLSPNDKDLYNAIMGLLRELGRYKNIIIICNYAIENKVDIKYILGILFESKMFICEWENFNILLNQLVNKINNELEVSPPFTALALIDDLNLQKKCAEIFALDQKPSPIFYKINKYSHHQKIRIGYFSSDFHNHATMHLLSDVFCYHDKNRFELYAFSFGQDSNDEWRNRAKLNFDQFLEVNNKSDIEIVSICRDLEIDIAIDLKGFTSGFRAGIFFHRAGSYPS
jgi:predicted O-linked N-acetylglucosamine transferase (SPINDLY family)